jgi:hypothetical protein
MDESQQRQEDSDEIVLLKRIARVEMSILKRALMLRRHPKKENQQEQSELVAAANTLCSTKVALLEQALRSQGGHGISLAS